MKKIIIVFILVCIIILGFGSAEAVNPKISSRLAQLIEKHRKAGIKGAKKFAVQSNIEVVKEDSVVVVLEIQPDKSLKSESLVSYNGEVKSRYRNLVETRIPIGELENIAEDFTQIQRVRLPLKPHPVEISEGVSLTGADIFQNEGYKGSGTKVAIIDAGFIGYPAAQSNGDLPSGVSIYDYSGEGMEEETNHGTAVAEIVYDMAPDAEFYLMKIESGVQLGNAKDDCKTLGIDIVNHSIVWFNSGPGDGTGVICNMANDAYDNGILWINSAGNQAQRHWQGAFVDNNSNGRHEFTPTDESNTVYGTISPPPINICLRWNDTWDNSDQDYDLWLFNDSGVLVAKSENRQNGLAGSYPTEEIKYNVPVTGNYHVVVVTHSTTGGHEIELFGIAHEFEHIVTARSICEPADSIKVLAVGAIRHSDWSSGPQEYFSSLGPTNDDRTKPDISGPDGVTSYTYGPYNPPTSYGFLGTSASSPHVAGAASLILCRNSSYTAAQLWQKLEQDAQDIGSPGKDNTYGAGKLVVKGVPPNAPLTLRCEGKENPVGLTVLNPEFSWVFSDNDPVDSQTAYQIIVSSFPANINSNIADTWDTGKTVSVSSRTTYGGPALSRGTTYYWKVSTWDEFPLVGPYCSAQRFQLVDSSPPAVVADLFATTGPVDGSVLLTWTAPGDDGTTGSFMGNYLIQHSSFDAVVWVSTAAQVNVSTDTVIPCTTQNFAVAGLTPRITYYLCLWTGDESGNLSGKSNITQSIVSAIPSSPTAFSGIGISTCGIKWTWNDTYSYEDGYYVMDSSNNILQNLPVNATSWIEISTAFTPNTRYARKAAAYAPEGATESDLGYAYTLSNPPYGLISTDQGPHTVTLSWTPGEGGNTRYAVERSSDGISWFYVRKWDDNINTNIYTDGPGLYHYTTYWFRVWGYNGDGIITSTHTDEISACTEYVLYTIYSPFNGGKEVASDSRTTVVISTGAFVEEGYIIINLDPLNNPLEVTFDQLNVADKGINTKRKVYDTATEFVVYNLWGLRSKQNFAEDVIITIPYSDTDDDGLVDRTNQLMPGMYEDTLKLYVLNETEKSWDEVENQTLNIEEDFVTAYVGHFSVYILLGKAPAEDLEKIAVFPNPCSISGSGITFVNLTEESKIRIYNMAGELVSDFDNAEGAYTKSWDLTNTGGQKVVPGMYVYLVTDWMYKGEKAVGKIAIIR